MFPDDAAHSPSHLQSVIDRFANAYAVFGLTISLKNKSYITINNYQLVVVDKLTYL